MTLPAASLIIPAHNEGKTIEASLLSLLDDPRRDELDVLVVCNACTDDTIDICRSFGAPVRVIESPIPSKAAALELGRQETADGPRMYIDADVVVSPGAISAVIDALHQPGIHAAAPELEIDPSKSTWPQREYIKVWTQAPYFKDNLVGAGFFAVSAEGSRRMGPFPDVMADDMFAVTRFRTHERAVAKDASFRPLMSTRLRDAVNIEIRRDRGRAQFADWVEKTGAVVHDHGEGKTWIPKLFRNPKNWVGLFFFIGAKSYVKARLYQKIRAGDRPVWTRDNEARSKAQESNTPPPTKNNL